MNEYKDFNKQLIAEFRANGGKITSGQFAGAPLILLTTVGAKSGQPHTSPVAYIPDGDRILIVASKAGAPTHPDWYHNLVANPRVTVELGSERFEAQATVPQGEERDRLFNHIVSQMSGFGEYQKNTTRIIPVVVLERIK
ncbi:hypothetical protein KDA_38020 [Dictyobacter alpinus]|uniref:Nitroreductase family deazaflavin-dependent oxidoreductase n=1 Tax=Dictyobacter alpinus TaxID=2014873 RepID=A0A402BAA6_9CHLR|nr:nitroreductase family deazaflavin-dependent oxidoreductase [Dictyobacter alpinus]GCE28318.1 hypothetical protein KDA_38020 [Dictyobacter alpinus]